jgi:hypothetical protein
VSSAPSIAVLGFRPHTYWTAVVALAGPAAAPWVIERRRFEFAAEDERFVFHQAADGDPAEAQRLIDRVRIATRANALREIHDLLAALQNEGVTVRIASTAAGAPHPPALEQVLKSHARIHAAEGAFYRDVIADACRTAGLEVHRIVERDLLSLVSGRLKVNESALQRRLKAMGEALGPPWSEDQRLATLSAWLFVAAPR